MEHIGHMRNTTFFLPGLGRKEINIKHAIYNLFISFTNVYNTDMDGQQAESTTNVPEDGNQ